MVVEFRQRVAVLQGIGACLSGLGLVLLGRLDLDNLLLVGLQVVLPVVLLRLRSGILGIPIVAVDLLRVLVVSLVGPWL